MKFFNLYLPLILSTLLAIPYHINVRRKASFLLLLLLVFIYKKIKVIVEQFPQNMRFSKYVAPVARSMGLFSKYVALFSKYVAPVAKYMVLFSKYVGTIVIF